MIKSMRDITLCHPRLQLLAVQLVEESGKQGLMIKIGETLRTVAEQDALYAQGRTKPGSIVTNAPGSSYSSYHQWGTAFDIFRNHGAGAYNDSGNFFTRVGAIGAALGLEWGGNWKSIVDKPHFQLPDWGSSTSGIKKIYANPEAFMKTWTTEKRIGWIKDNNGWGDRRQEGDASVGTEGGMGPPLPMPGMSSIITGICLTGMGMPAPAGTAGMAAYATRRTAPATGTISTRHRMGRWRAPAGIAGTTGHRGYGTWMPWIVFKKKRGALRD